MTVILRHVCIASKSENRAYFSKPAEERDVSCSFDAKRTRLGVRWVQGKHPCWSESTH